MFGKEFTTLLRTSSGIALGYQDIVESDFTETAGAAYVPPERGLFRRIIPNRAIQILSGCPSVVETFQTGGNSIIRLPALDIDDDKNDAADGRLFFFRNSGTLGSISIQDQLGNSLFVVEVGVHVICIGNRNENWDFYFNAENISFSSLGNEFTGKNIQAAIEECVRKQKARINTEVPYADVTNLTDDLTITLTNTSNTLQWLCGEATNVKIKLPDVATLEANWKFNIWNVGQSTVGIYDSDDVFLFTLDQRSFAWVQLCPDLGWQWWQILISSIASGIINYKVSSNVDFTSNSTTDILIPSMELTPQAGTYAVEFNSSVQLSGNNQNNFISIYNGTTKEGASERVIRSTTSSFFSTHSTLGLIYFDGSSVCSVRARRDGGSNFTFGNRSLLMFRLGA